jgi:hypothetical protein
MSRRTVREKTQHPTGLAHSGQPMWVLYNHSYHRHTGDLDLTANAVGDSQIAEADLHARLTAKWVLLQDSQSLARLVQR